MIKKLGIIVTTILTALAPIAQQPDPVHIIYNVAKTADKTFSVRITTTMDEGWHIYAQIQPKTAIAVPAKVSFTKNPLVTLQGPVKEFGKIEKQKLEEVGIEQNMYEKTVDFVQVVILKPNVKTNLSGTITYQACTNEMCLPAKTLKFSIQLQ